MHSLADAFYTFHLARVSPLETVRTLMRPPAPGDGLHHAECFTTMQLGAPLVSLKRAQFHQLAMFAAWESETALERFIGTDRLGRQLAAGWHVRMKFVRRWGSISELDGLPARTDRSDPDEPAVAVTIARMKLPQLPRFIAWGRPTESLVRDHPGVSLALATVRAPRTVATFSVWDRVGNMTDMVRGRGDIDDAKRHADAMVERERKDFHFEFTTLRFRPLSEHGSWDGRSDIVGLAQRARTG